MPAAAEVVCRVLRQAGARWAFATPAAPEVLVGGATRAGLDPVRVDATGAVVMAAATAVLTGRPGVVVAGVDLDEAAAALGHAVADRAPVILLSEPGPLLAAMGPGAPTGPTIRTVPAEPTSAAHQAAHACQVALQPPRGPVRVVLDAADATRPAVPVAVMPHPGPPPPPDPAALEAAAGLLAGADRPVILAGLACRDTGVAFWLRPLAEALPAPVVVTRAGRGALPDPHPLRLGRLGSEPAARVLERADLVVALGVDPLELADTPLPTPVLAIGPAGGVTGSVAVTGDLALVLEELAPRLRRGARSDWDVAELDRLKRRGQPDCRPGSAAAVVRRAREANPAASAALEPDPRLAGLDESWWARAPGDVLSAALPVAGFAVAAATAAALAGRRALAFTTPGGAAAAGAALALARARALDVAVVVLGTGDAVAGTGAGTPAGDAALAAVLGRPGPSVVALGPPV